MITMRRQLLGLGLIAASSILAIHNAQALSGPTAITIDGGPLGSLWTVTAPMYRACRAGWMIPARISPTR
jgi:hypothetical protein